MAFDVEERFVAAAEGKLGCRLPESYRAALMANNGGEVETDDDVWQLHPVLDSSDRKRIARTCNDIIRETEAMQEWQGWPEGALAIAANGGGDALVMLRSGGTCGPEVFHWDHETGEMVELAGDFGELMA